MNFMRGGNGPGVRYKAKLSFEGLKQVSFHDVGRVPNQHEIDEIG